MIKYIKENLGEPVECGIYLNDLFREQDGKMMLYTVGSGIPCVFNAYNITDKKLEMSAQLPGTKNCWSLGADSKGNIYIAPQDEAKLFRYSPTKKKIEDLGKILGEIAAYHVSFDEEDSAYIGTSPHGKVVKFSEGKFFDYGTICEGHQYIHSHVYDKGYLYAGTYANGAKLFRIDRKTGEKQEIPAPPLFDPSDRIQSYYSMTLADNYIFIFMITDQEKLLVIYDLINNRFLNQKVRGYKGLYASQPLDGKVYFNIDGTICSFDCSNWKIEKTVFHFKDEDCKGIGVCKEELLLLNHKTFCLHRMNVKTGVETRESVSLQAGKLQLQALEISPSGKLYIGAYMGTKAVEYEPEENKFSAFSMGQTEGILPLKDHTVFGVYPGGKIFEICKNTYEKKLLRILGQDQDRPFQMYSADNKLFIGTIPGYAKHGGALSIYDFETDNWEVFRHVVKNQSVIGLAFQNGIVYGSTSVWGGLGAEPLEQAAKVFRWNMSTKQTELERELYFSELSQPIRKIGNISFGKDGLLWGTAENIIFALNPENLLLKKYIQLDREVIHTSNWRPKYLRWGKDGRLYVNINGITALNIDTMETEQVLDQPTDLFVLDKKDNIYYADEASLMYLKKRG